MASNAENVSFWWCHHVLDWRVQHFVVIGRICYEQERYKISQSQIVRSKNRNIALDKDPVSIFEEKYFICCFYMNFLCWIHFCRMPSCKWHRFPQIVKFKMAVIRHLQFIFLSFSNTISWFGYLKCIVLMIWDMTTINGTRYVIEISWVRAPLGVCYFPRHKIVTVSRTFVS